jgi:hypothetical protein
MFNVQDAQYAEDDAMERWCVHVGWCHTDA